MLPAANNRRFTESNASQLFGKLDKDNNGYIDVREWEKGVADGLLEPDGTVERISKWSAGKEHLY